MRTILAVLALACVAACGGGGDGEEPPASSLKSVVYTVTANGATASVTYAAPGGGTEQTTSSSFMKSYLCTSGDFLYVSGQTNSSSSFASVTATIKVNGLTVQTRTSTGAFSIATATTSC